MERGRLARVVLRGMKRMKAVWGIVVVGGEKEER